MSIEWAKKKSREHKYKKLNKRGSLPLDVGILILVVFFLIVFSPLLYEKIVEPLFSGISQSGAFGQSAKDLASKINQGFPRTLENIFIVVLIFGWLMILILSFFIDTHPAFIIFDLIMLFFVLYMSIFLGNYAEGYIQTNTLSITRANMPVTTFVSGHVLEFAIAMSLSGLLVVFGKNKISGSAF